MKNTCVILEDDPTFSVLLRNLLKRFEFIEVIGSFTSTMEGAIQITKLKPDILFLDIEIDSLSGLEVLEILEEKPRTIVMSSNPDYVHDALALEIVDFLVKPIDDVQRLETAIKKALR